MCLFAWNHTPNSQCEASFQTGGRATEATWSAQPSPCSGSSGPSITQSICLRRGLGFSHSVSPWQGFQPSPDSSVTPSQPTPPYPSSASLPPQPLTTTQSGLSLPPHYQGKVIYQSVVRGTTRGLCGSGPWQGSLLAHQTHMMKTYCSENIVN